MLKICKNMQNTQNMHSCFKNAALCICKKFLSSGVAVGSPRYPPGVPLGGHQGHKKFKDTNMRKKCICKEFLSSGVGGRAAAAA